MSNLSPAKDRKTLKHCPSINSSWRGKKYNRAPEEHKLNLGIQLAFYISDAKAVTKMKSC